MKQRLFILELGHFAQELAFQVPEPPLKHLSKVTGQHCIRHVGPELVL